MRQTHSCVNFSHTAAIEHKRTVHVPEERPAPVARKRTCSFEESKSFDRSDSFEDEPCMSFPGSPVKRASMTSRIPRAKPTTPRQHIAEIRKSISNSSRPCDTKSQGARVKEKKSLVCQRSRADQFNAIGAAYQKVYGENAEHFDAKPPAVTLRSRPSSAKENTNRLSAPVMDTGPHTLSLPSSPKHGLISELAPGVRKRIPLTKCISVDERYRNRSSSIAASSVPNHMKSVVTRRCSVADPRRSPYRASYPNRGLASTALDNIPVKPRGSRRGSLQTDEHPKAEQPSEKISAPSRKNSVVKKRLPKTSTKQDAQIRENLKKTKDAVEKIARISNMESSATSESEQVPKDISNKGGNPDPANDGNISITTKTNKTENIKIHLGKTVDKSIETSTTVSVTIDGDKKKASTSEQVSQKPFGLGRSLLTKVKQLAEEIETLAMFAAPEEREYADTGSNRSVPHSCSMPVIDGADGEEESDTAESLDSLPRELSLAQRALLEQDSFSETEYLSINMRSPRNENSPLSGDQ